MCSFAAFFLVEIPAANLKALLMPKIGRGVAWLLRCGKPKRRGSRSSAEDTPPAGLDTRGLTLGSPSALQTPPPPAGKTPT